MVILTNENAWNAALEAGLTRFDAERYMKYVDRKERVIEKRRVSFRDSGKTKLYTAENKAVRRFKANGGELINFKNIQEVKKYVARITRSKTWQKLTENKGHREVFVVEMKDMGARTRIAGYATVFGSLHVSPQSMNQYTILHELAHLCGNMHHDIGFRLDLIKLCSRFVGVEFAKLLKEEFRNSKLKINVPKKILSPTEWLASAQKMEKIRNGI